MQAVFTTTIELQVSRCPSCGKYHSMEDFVYDEIVCWRCNWLDQSKKVEELERTNSALRGVITKLKNKR